MNDPVNDIQKQYKKVFYITLGDLACLIFGILSLFFEILIGITLIIAALVIYFALYRPNRHYYSDLVNKVNLERTICRLIDSPVPDFTGGKIFTASMLTDSDLLPEGTDGSKPLFCWEMKGHRKSFAVSLADTTVIQKIPRDVDKYTYYTNSGVFSVIGLQSDSHRYFLVMDRTFLPDMVREMFMNTKPEYAAGPISDEELNERYFLYRSAKDIKEGIPASFFQSLKRLMNYTPGLVAISIKGDTMYAFINSRFVSQDVPLFKALTTEDLDKDQFPELSYLINIAATLGGGGQKPEDTPDADMEPEETDEKESPEETEEPQEMQNTEEKNEE